MSESRDADGVDPRPSSRAHDAPSVTGCPHADRCPGCPLIRIPYVEQLASKRRRVSEALAPYAETARMVVRETAGADPKERYRTRAKLMIAKGPSVGLYAGNADHDVVDIPHCRVLSPTIERFVARLRGLLAAPPLSAGGALAAHDPLDLRGAGALMAIDVREAWDPSRAPDEQARLLVTLVLAREIEIRHEQIECATRAVGELERAVVGVAVNRRRTRAPQVLGEDTLLFWGEAGARDVVADSGVYQLATFGSFAQAHRGQAALIGNLLRAEVERVAESTTLRPTVLDLYAGSGALSLPLGAHGASVTMVEAFGPAAEGAERAASEQGISVEVVAADALVALRRFASLGRKFDLVVANPPRRGLHPEVRAAMSALLPLAVVYVSCDPDSLARDLAHLARLGYGTDDATPIDMIPQTDHVETVVVLRPVRPEPPRTLYAKGALYAIDKPPFANAEGPLAELGASPGDLDLLLLFDESGIVLHQPIHSTPSSPRGTEEAATFEAELVILAKGVTHGGGKLRLSRRGPSGKSAAAAEARYRRLAVIGGHSLLQIVVQGPRASSRPVRRALAAIGHPVIGDAKLGHSPTNRHFFERHLLDRPFVHCQRVTLTRPGNAEPTLIESEIPGDLSIVLARLGGPRLHAKAQSPR